MRTGEKYNNAPISELVLGIHFTTHILNEKGILFDVLVSLKEKFPLIETLPPLPDGDLKGYQLVQTIIPSKKMTSRFRMISADGRLIVQLQSNKILVNWVRKDENAVGKYPGFWSVYKILEEVYDGSVKIIANTLPDLDVKKLIKYCEVLYQDRIAWQQEIASLQDIDKILNVTLPKISEEESTSHANNIASQYTIPHLSTVGGYGIISIGTTTSDLGEQILSVETIVRGKDEKLTLKEWFEKANKIQVKTFNNLFSPSILEKWRD